MIKVNVWQVGFTTFKDYVIGDASKAKSKPMGFVFVENDENWAENTWNLLNWSCWTDKKPIDVHSSLDHCNSDVILQVDKTVVFYCALSVGWDSANSLVDAFDIITKRNSCFYPFNDVKRVSGYTKSVNGKAYYSKDRKNWEEITW